MEVYRGLEIDERVREAGASMNATIGMCKGQSLKEENEKSQEVSSGWLDGFTQSGKGLIRDSGYG